MQTFPKICLCFVLFLTEFASAQSFTQEGTIEMGGDISFSSFKGSESDEQLITLTFNPYIGYMMSPGFEIGLRPQLTMIDDGDEILTTWGVYMADAYHFNLGSTIFPYVEFLIGFNSIANQGSRYGGFGVGGDGGLKINISGNSLLLLKFEYFHEEYNTEGDYFSINTLSFGVGFRIFLAPKPAAK